MVGGRVGGENSRLVEVVVSCCQSSPSVRPSVRLFWLGRSWSAVRYSQTQTPPPFEVGGGYTLFYLANGHPQGGWRPRPTLIASERLDKARLVYVCARARSPPAEKPVCKEKVGGGGYVRSQPFSSGSHLLSVGVLPSGGRHAVLQSLADWINLAADPPRTWKNRTSRSEKPRSARKWKGTERRAAASLILHELFCATIPPPRLTLPHRCGHVRSTRWKPESRLFVPRSKVKFSWYLVLTFDTFRLLQDRQALRRFLYFLRAFSLSLSPPPLPYLLSVKFLGYRRKVFSKAAYHIPIDQNQTHRTKYVYGRPGLRVKNCTVNRCHRP